jgi:hypothetical protein
MLILLHKENICCLEQVGAGWNWLELVGTGWNWLELVGTGWSWLKLVAGSQFENTIDWTTN